MTNFDFLKKDLRFAPFADVAIAAEQLLHIDVDSCVSSCRRAAEFAVKWMYSVDRDLDPPDHDTLADLMNDASFKKLVGADIWRRVDFIRRLGNAVMHGRNKATTEQAEMCLENLFYFLDEVAYFYADEYSARRFDRDLLKLTPEEALSFATEPAPDLGALIEENRELKEELTARRVDHQKSYEPEPLDFSEEKNKQIFFGVLLQDDDWGDDGDCDVD